MTRLWQRRLSFGPGLLALGLALAGCGGEEGLTEVVIVVDSDLEVPFDIDGLRVTVSRGSDALQATGGLGPGQPPLPRTVSVVNESPTLGPFDARVELTRGGRLVVERLARFTFEAGARRRLTLIVPGACADVSCTEGQTCAPLGATNVVDCQDPSVTLSPFAGAGQPIVAAPLDAAPLDAAALDAAALDGGVP